MPHKEMQIPEVNQAEMKRPATSLVEYTSSDDDEISKSMETGMQRPKKRKLPPISSSLMVPVPVDNASLHQGRIRTTPHVDGQFSAHVYVSLALSRRSLLHKVIQDILCDVKQVVPSLHDFWPSEGCKHELHVSLSRPIFLRAHQREDLKRAVKTIAQMQKAFDISFTVLSELSNDERTRTFLTMEVGAGFHELQSLCTALAPTLKSIRQQEYYSEPKFHASIAWALLDRVKMRSSDHDATIRSQSDKEFTPSSASDSTTAIQDLSTIERLPQDLIVNINERYLSKLSSPKVRITAETINLKVGKERFRWKLLNL